MDAIKPNTGKRKRQQQPQQHTETHRFNDENVYRVLCAVNSSIVNVYRSPIGRTSSEQQKEIEKRVRVGRSVLISIFSFYMCKNSKNNELSQ